MYRGERVEEDGLPTLWSTRNLYAKVPAPTTTTKGQNLMPVDFLGGSEE